MRFPGAELNQSVPACPADRRRCEAIAFAGCTVQGAVHRRGKETGIFGMAVARKKPPMPPVTSTRLLVLHAARIRSAHGTVRLPCPAFVRGLPPCKCFFVKDGLRFFAFLQEKLQHCDFNHTKEVPPNPNLHGSEIGITAKTGKFETYKRAILLVAFVTLG